MLVTEGYTAGYAANPNYCHEATKMLDANQITVEHRFFGESVPEHADWQYMTVEQAATDHHRIVELFNRYYRGKWINTGISKGGQTALYHRYHYPEDVDVTVGYVCPLNFDDADTRVYDFLDTVGTATCRQKLHNFQKSMLEEKETMLPLFIQASKEKGYTYSMGYEAAYEYVILEYPFAFWQWGADCTEIPVWAAGDTARIRHLLSVSPMDYFADQGTERMGPFFYQALTEIGYYGYEPSEFGGLIKAVDDSTFNFLAPDTIPVSFDETHMRKVSRWLQNDAEKMLFLYGQYDPWSATGVTAPGNPGVVKIVEPEGSHRTRIRNLPNEQQEKVYQLLETWLGVEVSKL